MKKTFFILFLLILFLHLFFRIYEYRSSYTKKFDNAYWKNRYQQSQWVTPNSKNSIGDDGLYTYVGWEYIHGADPSLLNAELPPLGKYLIGLSEIIFSNENIFSLLSGIFALIAFYFLNKTIFEDSFLALIPTTIFSLEPLFYMQIRAPYLDTLYLGLLISTFIFVLKDKFILANILLGLTIATKSSLSTFILLVASILCYLIYAKKKKHLKKFIYLLPISAIVFLLTYTKYFLLGHNLKDFLALQKWVINFYQSGAKGTPISVWEIIISGKWVNWFGPIQNVSEWNILWPIALLTTIVYLYKVLPRRRQFRSVLLAFWLLIYLAFLTFIPAWPRYLLTALPFMYTLLIWVITKNIKSKKYWRGAT